MVVTRATDCWRILLPHCPGWRQRHAPRVSGSASRSWRGGRVSPATRWGRPGSPRRPWSSSCPGT